MSFTVKFCIKTLNETNPQTNKLLGKYDVVFWILWGKYDVVLITLNNVTNYEDLIQTTS